tara:strand:+ start:1253 stop:1423 length:171 start_codon:yes stop_codon:yes gene_type:complete
MYVIYVDGVEVFRSRDWDKQRERLALLRGIAYKRTIDRITTAYIGNEMIDGKLITY